MQTKRPRTPWKHLLLSKPQWATTIAHFCFNWSFFTILINVPMFLKEVLKFEVKSVSLSFYEYVIWQHDQCVNCMTLDPDVVGLNCLRG